MALLTLGQAVTAQVRLIVWCKACQRRVDPDIAELAERYGAATSVIAWVKRLRCSECGAREADFVVAGGEPWSKNHEALKRKKRPPAPERNRDRAGALSMFELISSGRGDIRGRRRLRPPATIS